MELDDALAATQPEQPTAVSTVRPRSMAAPDPERSRRGRSARNRGNAFEREVAKRLGARRVGQYGGSDDVSADWVSVQCKVGGYYPERIDGWLRALPANAGQLRAVVLGDAPGPGRRRRSLIVIDLDDFVAWFGKEANP